MLLRLPGKFTQVLLSARLRRESRATIEIIKQMLVVWIGSPISGKSLKGRQILRRCLILVKISFNQRKLVVAGCGVGANIHIVSKQLCRLGKALAGDAKVCQLEERVGKIGI